MRSRSVLVAAAMSVALAAPRAAPLAAPLAAQATGQPVVAVIPSITLPPDLDRVLRDYEKQWRAGDAAALAALFTEDGFVMQPGRPPVRGRAGLEAIYRGQGGGNLQLRALSFAASDTVAFIIGGYRYDDAPADMGKFTLTLRRASGGAWMIHSDMDSGNSPPRRAGALPPP